MARSSLSIVGLYNYDNTLFDVVKLPDGVDKDTLLDYIFMECAELELVYPSLESMRCALRSWSRARFSVWDKLNKLQELNYDPIANYDRKEEWSDTSDRQNGRTSSINGESESNTYNYGFNSSDPVNSGSGDDKTITDSAEEEKEAYSSKHTGYVRGNIGVTSTQDLINQERIVRDWTIYEFIRDDFKRNFCLMVY